LRAHRHSYRALLIAATALMAVTGLGFAAATQFWPLMLIAIVGTLNPSSGDVSVFLPLEHAVLSRVVDDRKRTAVFARYSLVGALAAAVGSLAAALPPRDAIPAMFVLYAVIALAAAIVYRGLAGLAGRGPASRRGAARPIEGQGSTAGRAVQPRCVRRRLRRAIDARAVAVPALRPVARDGGTLFFWTGVLTAFSYLVAVRIANRFGLVNTMVFTHIPSSLCLVAIPFVPDLAGVVALLLVRSALSQMDVPTRSSYVMAIVTPDERPAAAGITSVPRSLASAVSPVLAGSMLAASTFGWPLLIAGAVKLVYDVLLLATFRRVRPPEERRP
jgi:predicted MFS family arabinose efflux permease